VKIPTGLRQAASAAKGPRSIWLALLSSLVILALASSANAADATVVPLGTAANFGVLANTGITANMATTITNGDIGSAPTDTVTGSPFLVNGTNHFADAVTVQAKSDLDLAYINAASQSPATVLVGSSAG
jgi:hypothetical protein